MQVLWTIQARIQLKDIYEHILPESPPAALRQVHRIEDAVNQLRLFPEGGRIGRVAGTRELVVGRTEYIVAYSILDSTIRILAVRHSARLWPGKFRE